MSHGALAPGIVSADRPACGIRVIDVRVRWKVRLSHAAIGRAARLRGGCSFLFLIDDLPHSKPAAPDSQHFLRNQPDNNRGFWIAKGIMPG